MARHSFIQMSKLPNVKGRISYITSHARQENLYATYRTADSKAFIAGLGPDDHNFVAVLDDGTVIGCAGLTVCSNPRMRHAGSVGLYVHTDYQNKGVGTALMETLLDLADNWLMLVRVELEVYADNGGAIRLYERLGFETEGCKREAAVKAGAYVDTLVMARLRNR